MYHCISLYYIKVYHILKSLGFVSIRGGNVIFKYLIYLVVMIIVSYIYILINYIWSLSLYFNGYDNLKVL